MGKEEIRNAVKIRKKQLDNCQRKIASDRCFDNLEKCPEFLSAQHVLVFNSLPDEIDTARFIKKWETVKTFYLPRVSGNDLEILPLEGASMKEGAFHILEPANGICCNPDKIELIVVPAIAFDRKGNRIGRGKGYYDRLLKKAACPKIGVGYHFQLFDEIPTEPHDVPMNAIVTDTDILQIK